MSTLSNSARRILKIIHSLQHEGRPRVDPESGRETGNAVLFPCVPLVFIMAELWDVRGGMTIKKIDFDLAVIELKTKELIEDVVDETTTILGSYCREDGIAVLVHERAFNGTTYYAIAIKGRRLCQVRVGSVKAVTLTAAGCETLDGKPQAKNVAGTPRRRTKIEWLAEAMLTIQKNPELSDAKVAKKVGVDPGTLSRCKQYKSAACMARTARLPHRGYLVRDNSGIAGVESYADDSEAHTD